jgi:peptide/nickel transport system permease protein
LCKRIKEKIRNLEMSFKRPVIRFINNPQAVVGFALVLLVILTAIAAPVLKTHSISEMQISKRLSRPSSQFLMGTDEFGRDIFSRVIEGTRVSVLTSSIAVLISLTLGTVLGTIAGFFGGTIDNSIMRLLDVFFAFPALLLALAVVAILGPGLINAMLAIGIVFTPYFARVIRASVLSIRNLDYVKAACSIGGSNCRIIFRHILPNSMGPTIVQTAVGFSNAILAEASLSFLGLGVQSPTPSWGRMLNDAQQYLLEAPWYAIFPGIAIILTTMGFNLLGEGLRILFDPRSV